MNNILIISDIHGSHQRLMDVLNTPHEYDMLILVGDFLYHGPRNPILEDYNPQAVADQLNAIDKPILAVRGNCDAEVDQWLLNFPMMQDYTITTIQNLKVYITHGHIVEPKDAPTTKADIFISGHTHVPGFTQNEMTVCLNPGSISLPKENHPNTYAIFHENEIVIYDLKHKPYLTFKIEDLI